MRIMHYALCAVRRKLNTLNLTLITYKIMYYVEKTLEISSCHQLYLDYESKCENLHGHNWIIKVYCKAKELDSNGLVCDFTLIKKLIHDRIDHKNLNSREHSTLGGRYCAKLLPRRRVGVER